MNLLKFIYNNPKYFIIFSICATTVLIPSYFYSSQRTVTSPIDNENVISNQNQEFLRFTAENIDVFNEFDVNQNPHNFTIQDSDYIITQSDFIEVNSPLNLLGRGDGHFSLENRDPSEVTSVSVIISQEQKAEVAFTVGNNYPIRFSGTAVRKNSQMIEISLTSSGMADAEGSLLVQYQENEIKILEGKGLLDYQPFSMKFINNISDHKNDSNEENFNNIFLVPQKGRGLWSLDYKDTEAIDTVMFQTDEEKGAIVSLGLSDGSMIIFRGEVGYRDAYSVTMEIDRLGVTEAQGFIKIEYGMNNSINHLMGDGKLGDQSFLINFSK